METPIKSTCGKLAALAIAAYAILPARAGSIVWEGAQNITGTGDARTEGTLLYAYAKGTATLNGVPFADGLSTASAAQTSYIPNNAASPQDIKLYGNGDSIHPTTQSMSAPSGCDILKSFVYNSTANIMTVTLQNLTEGHRYLVQLWVQDSRNNTNLRTRYVRPDGNAAAQAQYYVSSTGYGQHVTGIFVATGTTQDFTLNPGASKGTACAQINAIQVRDLGVGGIAWEEAQNITGTGDARTEGTLLYAYAKGTATLNGVAFADGFTDGFSTSTGTATNFIPSNAETPKDIEVSVGTPGVVLHTTQALSVPTGCDILKNFIYDHKETTATVTLRNLVAGRRYLVQFWANDTRTSGNCKTRFEVVDGVNVVKYCNGSYGQHITGTFTAADDTQSFTLTPQRGSSTSGSAQINAIQVRDLGAIDWEPAQNITGTGDARIEGTLLYAYAINSATLNGVNFAAGFDVSGTQTATIPNNEATPDDIEFTAAAGNIAKTTQSIAAPSGCEIIKSFIYCENFNVNATVMLRNLTPGNRYLVQFWANDTRTASNLRTRSELVDGGNEVKYCNGSCGQHVTGTFTAVSDTVFFTLSPLRGSCTSGCAQINAIQVRDLGAVATQTWSGAAGTSLSWNGQNWDGNANTWTGGNDAVFATDGAIADVDSSTWANSVTFNENATVTGSKTLSVTEVSVASGVSAAISAPTVGALTKTGAGTLVLGSSRTTATTLSEGVLELSDGVSLDWQNFRIEGGALTAGVIRASGELSLCACNSGEYVVTNELEVTMPNAQVFWGYDHIADGVFKIEKVTLKDAYGMPFFFGTRKANAGETGPYHFYIGGGGLCFGAGAHRAARYETGSGKNNKPVHIDPWHSDYHIYAKDAADDTQDFHMSILTHFGTTDENGIARTVTADGIFAGSAAMHIDGAGTFVCNAVNTYSGAVSVNDTATLAVNAGKKVTSGAITVGATATLEVAQSGTVALGGSLSLADGATLAFNYTDKTVPVLDATDKTVTFGGASNIVVKVSAADGKRARGGANVLTSGGKFAGANVTLVTGAPDWAKGVRVVDGEIVLNVRPSGMIIIVK